MASIYSVAPGHGAFNARINITLDVGHSSIGWAVITDDPTIPLIKACGVMIFGESCQNSARAGFRRMRRNIASRRNRVRRLAQFLEAIGALDAAKLKVAPTSSPWRDAARVLSGIETLDWPRLWNVIRWYAHNRGYDGNAAWSHRVEADDTDGDTEKEKQALKLMERHGTTSMAATVCAALQIDPSGGKVASNLYFKGYNAAFPRKIVESEVLTILEKHRDSLPGIDAAFIACLMTDTKAHPVAPTMAKRYRGGLLFGQMIPRFDNRIIPSCLVSEKATNTPDKHSREFYRYRWAQLLGNVRVQGADGMPRALTGDERGKLDRKMRDVGRMTAVPFKLAVKEITGCDAPKLESLFMTEEMENALMLDPVRYGLLKNPVWKTIWENAVDPHRRVLENILFKRRPLTPDDWFSWLQKAPRNLDTKELERRCETAAASAQEKIKNGKATKKDPSPAAFGDWRHTAFGLSGKADEIPSGRARYATKILKQAADEYMRGDDARASGGVLFSDPSNPDDPQQKRLLRRATDDSTNNHLVRQRLLVLDRLVGSLVDEFAGGDKARVGVVAVEVVRDLQQFSGLDAQEVKKLLSRKIQHHKNCAKALEEAFKSMGLKDETTASLIRKFRIADDLGWTCPYTLQKYSPAQVIEGKLELEHIIPRAWRPSDALDSLVLTYPDVNKLKGARTSLAFIKEFGGMEIPGKSGLTIMAESRYRTFVDGLRPSKASAKSTRAERKTDDEKRVRHRKKLLLTEHYDKRDADFTGRDLTQTSHLVKLATRRLLASGFAWSQVKHVPGSVTVAVRKGWPELFGALMEVIPATRGKTKDEIRGITHLHHAVDAATIAFALTKFPDSVWKLMGKRRVTGADQAAFGAFAGINKENGDWRLYPLSEKSLGSLREALAERRVRQHLPHSYRGLRVELNPWRVVGETEGGKINLTQKKRTTEMVGEIPQTKLETKTDSIKPSKLLGFRDRTHHGKLGVNKSVLVIGDNYGVALDPEPVVIPHYKVYPTLRDIARKNGGKWPRVLRNGMMIEVPRGRYQGVWRICSVKDNASGLALDLASPDEVKPTKINVLLPTLLKDGVTSK